MLKRFLEDKDLRLLVIALTWTLWFLVAVVQSYLSSLGQDAHIFRDKVIGYGYVGILWAFATPMVLYFARTIKYNNHNLGKVVLYHLLANLFILVFRTLPFTFLNRISDPPDVSFLDSWINVLGVQLLGNVIIYGLIVASYYAIVWHIGYKDAELKALTFNLRSEQLERQLSEANLTALRMQLNPHFLFNTLNSVASLIRIKQNTKAIETLSTLSDLLRSTVYDGIKNEITIEEEVAFIKRYLTIEQLRFSDRLEINFYIEESLLHHKIPSFLLQPLVENALKHGLKDSKNGKLTISIKSTNDKQISFLILDNGIGLPSEKTLEHSGGVGLKNTVNRLQGTYAGHYEFSISNNSQPPGVQVKMVLPFNV